MKKIIYTLVLLTIPFLSNIYINDFNWSLVDFIIMSVLIFSCLSFTGFIRKKFSGIKEILAIIIVVIVFILLWAELAVGILGSPLPRS